MPKLAAQRVRMSGTQLVTALGLSLMIASVVVALASAAPAQALPLTGTGAFAAPTPVRGFAPGSYGPPPAPTALYISDWGSTSVTITWQTSPTADITIVQREVAFNVWSTLATWGQLAKGTMTFTDTSAVPNTGNCYRVLAGNAYGYSSWSSPDIRCVVTRDGRDIPVARVELFVRIANIAGAGNNDAVPLLLTSGDPVQVQLQGPAWLVNWRPAGNASWVDTTADDDFGRGVGRWYELLTDNVKVLSDITQITLEKPGFDDMCVAEIALRINGNGTLAGLVVYRHVYGETSSTCRWVTDASPLNIYGGDLHASSEWQAATKTPNLGITTNEWLRAQIQASFANTTHGTDARLGGGSITTERLSRNTLRVRVPLLVDASIFGQAQTWAHFDLNLDSTCSNNIIHTVLTATNINADSLFDNFVLLDLVENIVAAPVLWHISDEIESAIGVDSIIDVKMSDCMSVLGFTLLGDIGLVAP